MCALHAGCESGETLLADDSGGIYRLDRRGRLAALTRGFHGLALLAGDDVGASAVAVHDETQLSWLDDRLEVAWSIELPRPITGAGIDSYGRYVAVALDDGKNVVYDRDHRRIFLFETERPMRFLRFLSNQPAIVAAADYGMFCRFDFEGNTVWMGKTLYHIGELTCTGDGSLMALAAFARGVKLLDSDGEPAGTYLLEGTPNGLSISFAPFRLAVTTLEGHLYWLNESGDLVWGAALPEEVTAVATNPLGDGLVCGFASGEVIGIGWD
ncbi:MAG: hypothetical protein ACE5KM_06395 [Planctomycetaceae bacterium]